MPLSAIQPVLRFFSPARLTGPIFTKELRVASRRKRNYVLRLIYVGLMLLFVGGVWAQYTMRSSYSQTNVIAEMSQMGKSVIMTVAWFQFCMLQLVALVVASTSINQEITSRTLGVLMTTPITSSQIVFGKVLGKMLQLLTLLAISVPILVLLRVLGGVPWQFVISTTCVTLTASLFAAALSLFYSSFIRRPYAVILLSMGTMLVLYVIIVWILSLLLFLLFFNSRSSGAPTTMFHVISAFNPYFVMGWLTVEMETAGRSPMGLAPWILHCGVMLGLSTGLLLLTVPLVRRKALRDAIGAAPSSALDFRPLPVRKPTPPAAAPAANADALAPVQLAPLNMDEAFNRSAAYQAREEARSLRAVSDQPVLWREIRSPLIRTRFRRLLLLGISLGVLLLLYLGTGKMLDADNSLFHAIFCVLFTICAIGCTVVTAATGITAEKESGSMPLLLATPLSDWAILWGKAAGAARRCLPMWGFLLAHAVVFSAFLAMHPIVILHVMMLTAGTSIFLIGSGLYFSARFRKTTTAVVANLALAIFLWVLAPSFHAMFGQQTREVNTVVLGSNPVIMSSAMAWGAANEEFGIFGSSSGHHYDLGGDDLSMVGATIYMLVYYAVYSSIGLVFFWLAKRRLRRDIF